MAAWFDECLASGAKSTLGSTYASEGATNRFAVLAEPDTRGTVNVATDAARGIQKEDDVATFQPGQEEEVSWSQTPKCCFGTLAFRESNT